MGSVTNFPFGVSSFGQVLGGPGPSSIPNPSLGGQTFFVDPDKGSDGNFGDSSDSPLATITRANALARDGAGDSVFLFPGTYDENVVITKDYLALIGCVFAGYARPDITPASGVPLTVQAQGFMSRHCRFAGTAADGVVQQGNGFLYTDCVFDGDLTALKAGLRLRGLAADTHFTASEGLITKNLFRGSVSGLAFDSASAPNGVGSTDNVVDGNLFYSNTKDITAEKSGAGGVYSCQLTNIINNYFADKNKAVYIDLLTNIDGPAASQTGTLMNNYFNSTAALTNVLIKINGTGFACVAAYSAIGITNASAF
jgi:hypothetical protein